MARPFDARLTLLEQQGLPQRNWRTVSLVTALRECFARDTYAVVRGSEDRVAATVKQCAQALTLRGIPGEALVRYGLFPEISSAILDRVIAVWLGASPNDHWVTALEPQLEAEHLDPAVASDWTPEEWSAAIVAMLSAIAAWVSSAHIDDIIALRAPPACPSTWTELADLGEVGPSYRWCVERFSVTSLEDWSTHSLHEELRWVNGEGAAPCESHLMFDRGVTKDALQRVVSARAVSQNDRSSATAVASSALSFRMQDRAASLLMNDEFDKAASLFEFALKRDPEDPVAANNLAFCLIPTDLKQASELLTKAEDGGFKYMWVLTYNRMAIELLRKNPERALRLAEDVWTMDDPGPDWGARLWQVEGSDLDGIVGFESTKSAVVQLALEAASQTGSPEMVDHWSSRSKAA